MASVARGKASQPASPDRLLKLAVIVGIVLIAFLAIISAEMLVLVQQMRQLGSAVPNGAPTVSRLDAIRSDLDRMQPDLHQTNVRLAQVQDNTSGLAPSVRDLSQEMAALESSVAQINSDLTQISALLRDIDQHVANLDRKTGPTPPALP